MFPSSLSMTTQRQQSGSTTDGRATPERDETSGVPSSPAPKDGGVLERTSTSLFTKPDKAAFQAEEARIRSEIDEVQAKLATVRDKLSLSDANRPDAAGDKRATLRAELDDIRGKHSGINIQRQINSLQDSTEKRIKNLQVARAKIPFRTVTEVEARIESLKKQIKSGSMRIVEEKRAVRELSQLGSSRKAIEALQSKEDAIEADRRALDELRKQLDHPEKALPDRYEAAVAELDVLKKEIDEFYAGRAKLIQERNALQARLNDLWKEKRDLSQRFRDASDRYWAKVQEGRDHRYEKVCAQNAVEEARKLESNSNY